MNLDSGPSGTTRTPVIPEVWPFTCSWEPQTHSLRGQLVQESVASALGPTIL